MTDDEYCTECGEYVGRNKLYHVDWNIYLCWRCLKEWEVMWHEFFEMFGVGYGLGNSP